MSTTLLLPSHQPSIPALQPHLFHHNHHFQLPSAHAVPEPYYLAPTSISTTYKSGVELTSMCVSVIRTLLCGGNLMWDMDRLTNFTLYCNRLLIQLDISAPVAYTSLKYLQRILASSVNEFNIIDLSDTAHEYSLFTVSLLLAHKFLEDNPPYMKQWSYVSLLPLNELTLLESRLLEKLDYCLNISNEQLNDWVEQCNQLYTSATAATTTTDLDQLNQLYDLHRTRSLLGFPVFLPVLLLENYLTPIATIEQPMYSNIDILSPQQPQDYRGYSGDYLLYNNTHQPSISSCSNNNTCTAAMSFPEFHQQDYFQYPTTIPITGMVRDDVLFDESYYFQQQLADIEEEELTEDEIITPPSVMVAPSAMDQQLLLLLLLQQQQSQILEPPIPNAYPHPAHNNHHSTQQQQFIVI